MATREEIDITGASDIGRRFTNIPSVKRRDPTFEYRPDIPQVQQPSGAAVSEADIWKEAEKRHPFPQKPEGFEGSRFLGDVYSRPDLFEAEINQQLGGDPLSIDPHALVEQATQRDMPKLFYRVFGGSAMFADRERLPKKEQDLWNRTLVWYRAQVYQKAVALKKQKVEMKNQMMTRFNNMAKSYEQAKARIRAQRKEERTALRAGLRAEGKGPRLTARQKSELKILQGRVEAISELYEDVLLTGPGSTEMFEITNKYNPDKIQQWSEIAEKSGVDTDTYVKNRILEDLQEKLYGQLSELDQYQAGLTGKKAAAPQLGKKPVVKKEAVTKTPIPTNKEELKAALKEEWKRLKKKKKGRVKWSDFADFAESIGMTVAEMKKAVRD